MRRIASANSPAIETTSTLADRPAGWVSTLSVVYSRRIGLASSRSFAGAVSRALDDEHVPAADVLQDPDEQVAFGEPDHLRRAEPHAEPAGDRLARLRLAEPAKTMTSTAGTVSACPRGIRCRA
jgi:hypothetical protein